MGHGILHTTCTKQKNNTKSSTEKEVVGDSDYIPWTVWAKRFFQHQGYGLKEYILSDNERATKIEKRWKVMW